VAGSRDSSDSAAAPAAELATASTIVGPLLHVLVGLIEDEHGRILINQRRPGTHMAGFWEFPGGKLAAGETARQALDRELAEELGIAVLDAVPFMQHRHDYPEKRVLLDIWRVLRYAGSPLGLEAQDLAWVRPQDLMDFGLLPADRPIVDALLEH
jgi:8-oxo-dGTP diphosphatase